MITIPKYTVDDIVNIVIDDEVRMVSILNTTILVETNEVFYKVALCNLKEPSEFVVSEDQILSGYTKAPIPAFSVGDVVTFNHVSGNNEVETVVGMIDEVYIKWDSTGYIIYYQTDETPEGTYTYEEDIICKEVDEEEEELTNVI